MSKETWKVKVPANTDRRFFARAHCTEHSDSGVTVTM